MTFEWKWSIESKEYHSEALKARLVLKIICTEAVCETVGISEIVRGKNEKNRARTGFWDRVTRNVWETDEVI